jgi:excisionase family DNA binding protein
VSRLTAEDQDVDMKRDARPPVIRLLTVPEAADRLGLTPPDVDRMVETGHLCAVHVSPRGGRRFWPADVEACATAGMDQLTSSPSSGGFAAQIRSASAEPAPAESATIAPSLVRVPPRRVRTSFQGRLRRPRWPRFEVVAERVSSTYLGFRDAEHVTDYLRARASLALNPEMSTIGQNQAPRGATA